MTNPVFFAEPAELAPLRPDTEFTLAGPEARHAATVRRLGAGEEVDVVDGRGRRITGTVQEAGPSALRIRVDAVRDEPAPAQELVLVQALAKGDRDEMAVESATELGIDAVVPWQAERSIVRWRAEKAARGRQKWVSTVAAAAKQSRRAWVPQVLPLVDSAGLGRLIADAGLALVLHEAAGQPLAAAVAGQAGLTGQSAPAGVRAVPADGMDTAGADPARRILIIVGPEGGISGRELAAFTGAGARPVRLGPHVLRSSTAGPAAVTLLSHLLGRW